MIKSLICLVTIKHKKNANVTNADTEAEVCVKLCDDVVDEIN